MFDILKLIPQDLLEGIDVDSLIKNKSYYPPDNTEEEIIKYTIAVENDAIGVLRIEMSFETGQRAFIIHELKRIEITDKEFLVVYSRVSGAPIVFAQSELQTYLFKNGILTKTKDPLLPLTIGLADFLKRNTPDSLIQKYSQYSNHCYELIYEGRNICYVLYENFDLGNLDKSWLLGNKIEFVFRKRKFKRLLPYFTQE
ncbi:hypothetical protein ACFQ21_02935 [Ohtaekwangia kribbensis]|uniref:Uncharacterized protein n=2 Tax=Ohtaekwangia kribbensis TaxID=688913 RepID=A0ABW3JWK5_9BACT